MSSKINMRALSSRLRALISLLLKSGEACATSSPEAVLERVLDMLRRASPAARLAIALSTPIFMLYTAIAKYELALRMLSSIKRALYAQVTSQIRIGAGHPLQQQVMTYLAEHGLKNTRRLALAKSATQQSAAKRDHYLRYGMEIKTEEKEEKEELIYVPDVGSYDFTFRGYRMRFERSLTKLEDSEKTTSTFGVPPERDEITLSCLSFLAGVRPIQDFLLHIRSASAGGDDAMTKFFRPAPAATAHDPYRLSHRVRDTAWDSGVVRPRRKLAAVTLDAHVKEPLVKDIQDYLDPRTKQFYVQNGIPYRKGYLAYGPPGTGKTSFAAALAGEYGLNVYLLNLSSEGLTDQKLETLFEELPKRCIVLLEDVDSCGIRRENMGAQAKKQKSKKQRRLARIFDENLDDDEMPAAIPVATSVTLSGLLNVLDGVTAAEGRLVIMTTNNPDSLDKALVRPGRIDKKVLFGNASHEVAVKMFTRIFTKSASQLLDGEVPFANVERLAKEFADQIPQNPAVISPARVQCHLLAYRTDPVAAVAATATFVAEAVEESRSGKNVASFDAGLGSGDDEKTEGENSISHTSSSDDLDPRKRTEDLAKEGEMESEGSESEESLKSEGSSFADELHLVK